MSIRTVRGLKAHWHTGSSTCVHEEVHLAEVACEHPPHEPARVRQLLSRERGAGRGGGGEQGREREGGRERGRRERGGRERGGREGEGSEKEGGRGEGIDRQSV